ncbi:unnamed protein product, partial [Rotaria magnacalcarata]
MESELEEDNECDSNENDDDYFHSSVEEKNKNKQTLNSVFELLGISPVTDRRHTQVLRRKIDDAYKNMLKFPGRETRREDLTRI